jgi:2-oxoglutarate dehydrogenase E1 component
MNNSLEQKYISSPLFGANAPFIEAQYEQYLEDPEAVEPHWRDYFRGFETASPGPRDVPRGPVETEIAARARRPRRVTAAPGGITPAAAEKQAAVILLIWAYRACGHLRAELDPLGLYRPPAIPDLELDYHSLSQADLDTEFDTGSLVGPGRLPLREIVALLDKVYCGSIGYEYVHVTDAEERRWLRQRIEGGGGRIELDKDEKRSILRSLTAAEGIEKFLHTRYVGQKRFSLEGGEALIPQLHDLIEQSGRQNIEEIVIGMAHRGRINVLINVMGKSSEELFSEFEGTYDPKQHEGSGDVKYHLGFSTDIENGGGHVHVALAFNPSHLESTDPVVEGSVRARQDRRADAAGAEVLPVLIHGDASFSGQGVLMETLQLSRTPGFTTGGTVHLLINNQIGFTTDPEDARSTAYSSDVAKMLGSPIFHVNGDDPEAVIAVTRLALDYRQTFHKDVFVDLVCYRRHGHNEADEPAATQPIMYKTIRSHPTVLKLYAERMQKAGAVSADDLERMAEQYRHAVEQGQPVAPATLGLVGDAYTVDWSQYHHRHWDQPIETGLDQARFDTLARAIVRLPEDFHPNNRVKRVIDGRRQMVEGEMPIDWGFAETMAYASLLTESYGVRLSGQDSARGTFFHRHAVLHDRDDGAIYIPLEHLAEDEGRLSIVDSPLSEAAVVGFEYGYATAEPEALVIWEAQYGDFANGAQVMIDQFISSGEAKWGRLCGLTMFLPHGYEGQGPEHSSARLERYLQLCAEGNMQVCVPTTPAQMFHMLRRQLLRPYRKPLIVMTPKSLLRHRLTYSAIEDFLAGSFRVVIPEIDDLDPEAVERVVFCSGKVYYDLLEARRANELGSVAIVRIEQLYPFPQHAYADVIATYSGANDVVWCQEEPENQGAWYQIRHHLQEALASRHTLSYAGRAASASTAAGYMRLHTEQQKALIEDALGSAMAGEAKAKKSGKRKKGATEKHKQSA